MRTIKTVNEMKDVQKHLHKKGMTIGFVPTMGYLHEGHLRLVKEARKQNDLVVVSIFVNPLQFNQTSDLEGYPRDFARDEQLLANEQVDYIFYPSQEEMYPSPLSIEMSLIRRGDVLCGATRPGHFEGVLVVLTKLFHIIGPDQVYFGIKDAQQVAVVDALITDLNFDLKLVPVPTVREPDGLAMSSRNVNLKENERKESPYLYQALLVGASYIQKTDSWTRSRVIDQVKTYLKQHISGKIDYVDCLSYPDLEDDIHGNNDIIIAIAVKYQDARLIDNVILSSSGDIKYRSE
ncbi:pantoate--beta-alanine ligase [Alkalibacillus aidingensis]|uniref:pantoate--beta-alanine ligase n=1 Tax=Alkalibacillus aidingensis TaxID=2747607 RepID=UPI00166048A4|nr:pantoate--beta-alanine ligase [Alkalibacillus aidingensis]